MPGLEDGQFAVGDADYYTARRPACLILCESFGGGQEHCSGDHCQLPDLILCAKH
jgi:hypothetical protein